MDDLGYSHSLRRRYSLIFYDLLFLNFDVDFDWNYSDLIEIENIYYAMNMKNKNTYVPFKDLKLQANGIKVTALVFTCLKGNLEMVKHVVEVWGADVNEAGNEVLCDQPFGWRRWFKEVTPLFAAALKKKKDIVCYLLEKGAIFSKKTDSNCNDTIGLDGLTPLHAAFYLEEPEFDESSDDQIDIIRRLVASGADPSELSSKGIPIWTTGWIFSKDSGKMFSGWCSTNAIKTLIQLGMNPNGRDITGRTLLHHLTGLANFRDDVETVKFLLENGAARDLQAWDKYGLTPIMHAAIGSYRPGTKKVVTNINILKYLLEKEYIKRTDKIDALELAAAVLLNYYPTNPEYLDDIIYFLTQSKIIRQLENRPLIINQPSNGSAVEWITSAPAEEIKERIVECGLQSMLIRLRIFSSFGWRTVNRYLYGPLCWSIFDELVYIRPDENLSINNYLYLYWAVLEYVLQVYSNEHEFRWLLVGIINGLVETLKALKEKDDPLFNIESIKTSMNLVIATYRKPLHKFKDRSFTEAYLKHLVNLISMLDNLPSILMNENIMEALRPIFSDYVIRDDRQSLMHKACKEQTTNNLLATVRLLLLAGADPNYVDVDGNGPLHFLARRTEVCLEENEQINLTARLLLDAGSHLDLANKLNMTAGNDWIIKKEKEKTSLSWWRQVDAAWIDLPDWLKEDVPKLSCLSARIVRCNGVPYLHKLPLSLCRFVEMHSIDGAAAIPISRLIEKLNRK